MDGAIKKKGAMRSPTELNKEGHPRNIDSYSEAKGRFGKISLPVERWQYTGLMGRTCKVASFEITSYSRVRTANYRLNELVSMVSDYEKQGERAKDIVAALRQALQDMDKAARENPGLKWF